MFEVRCFRFCPIAVIEGAPSGSVQRPQSNTLWAPFDNTESGLDGRERDVVGNYGLDEALEGERANLFGHNASL